MDQLNTYTEKFIDFVLTVGPKLITAIVVLVIGFWVIKKINKIILTALQKAPLSEEITSFLGSLASIALKVLLIFTVAGIVGIETTSFVAVLAAAGFAVGLALQGSLGNFAAGIIIIMFKPYRVGDWVSIQDKFGKVQDIQIFNTIVETPGQNMLIIPNGQVIDDIVTNFSSKGFVRLELEVTMPYSESFPKVKDIIKEALQTVDGVLEEPKSEIGILDFDTHNVIVTIRPYCLPDNYWDVRFAVYAAIKRAFHEARIQVAYSEGVEMGTIGG